MHPESDNNDEITRNNSNILKQFINKLADQYSLLSDQNMLDYQLN